MIFRDISCHHAPGSGRVYRPRVVQPGKRPLAGTRGKLQIHGEH